MSRTDIWTPEQVQAHLDKLKGKEPKSSPISEREFQNQVTKIATQFNWLWYHTHDSIGSQAGFPDLCLVRKGRLMFVELKAEHGKLSLEQNRWLYELRSTVAETYIWRPSMMQEIIEILK
jgi:hypothetical protein